MFRFCRDRWGAMLQAWGRRSAAALAAAVLAVLPLAGALAQSAGAPPGEPAARFDILEYRVEGNSLMPDESIERALMPHMGEARTLADVEAARASLEKRYHDAGYLTVVVSIPEQKVEAGVVNLRVTEAPVSRLRVAGAQYHLPSTIRERLAEVAEGRVPNFQELQKALTGVNRSADLKVAPVLKPGRVPGTVEVQLEVDDQLPLHGNVEINNRQSPNTSAARLSASLRYDNLWQKGHSIGLSVQGSPQDLRETQVISANYMLPLGADGDALSLYAVRSRSQFATLFNSPGLGLLGNTQILGLRYTLPLDGTANFVQTLSVGADSKNVQQSLQLAGGAAPTPGVHYVPLSLAYRGVWPGDQPQATSLDLNAIMGLRGLLGNTDASFQAKRAGASASFLALRSTLQMAHSLQKWTLSSRLEWQLASGALLPSEQFVAGGADSVRGYLEGERSGDGAVRMSFELSSPPLKVDAMAPGWRMVALAFFDEALLHTAAAAAGQKARTTLAGAGLGLRVSGPGGTSLQLDAARALTDGDLAGGGTPRGHWRVHVRLNSEF